MYYLKTPLSIEDIEKLRIGDIIYLSGIVITARDLTHKLILEKLRRNEKLPIDLKGSALYHAGPVVKKINNEWKIISIGPTTSTRMEFYEYELIEKVGIKLIIGKGGMGEKTRKALMKFKACYAIFPGGCGVLAARQVRKVLNVYFIEELGQTEAMWVLEVENFGPLIVVMDSHGNDLYRELKKRSLERMKSLIETL